MENQRTERIGVPAWIVVEDQFRAAGETQGCSQQQGRTKSIGVAEGEQVGVAMFFPPPQGSMKVLKQLKAV